MAIQRTGQTVIQAGLAIPPPACRPLTAGARRHAGILVRSIRRIALALAVVIGPSPTQASNSDPPQVVHQCIERAVSRSTYEDGVRGVVAALEEHRSGRTDVSIATYYGKRADLIVASGPRIQGRNQIAAYWGVWASTAKWFDVQINVESVRPLSPCFVVANLTSTMRGQALAGDPIDFRDMRETLLLAKTDAGWLIEAHRVQEPAGAQVYIRGTRG